MLAYPMRWRWACAKAHYTNLGVDLGSGDDRTVEAVFVNGKLVSMKDVV